MAVTLPEEVRDALGRLQQELRRRDLSDLRWVRPEGIHLTLKFLGETPAGKVTAIAEGLAGALRGRQGFRLALSELGTFGGRRRPRVLWLDLTGDVQRLREVQQAVEAAMVQVGFPPEDRGFSPHLTLARVRQPARPDLAERLSRALESVTPPPSELQAREVVLMRSTLRPGGAAYQHLADFPLG